MSPGLQALLNALLSDKHSVSMAGTAANLGASGGQIDDLISKLRRGSVSAFGSQQELGGGLKQIEDLKKSMEERAASMQAVRAHSASLVSGYEDKSSFYHSPEMGAQERARQARAEEEHQRQMQAMQKRAMDLQARAAATINPQSAAGLARQGSMLKAGAAVGIGAAGAQLALRGWQAGADAGLSLVGGPGATVAQQMTQTATGAASNVIGGAATGATIGALGGPAGMAAGAAIGALASGSAELIKMPTRVKDWGEALVTSQGTIAKFSGALSRAFAQRDLSQMRRDIQSAQYTGAGTADLSESLNKLYDGLRPLKDQLTIATSGVLRELVDMISRNIPLIETLIEVIAKTGDAVTLGSAHLTDLLDASKKSMELDRRIADANKRRLGAPISGAIARLLAEDPNKPRQAPRR